MDLWTRVQFPSAPPKNTAEDFFCSIFLSIAKAMVYHQTFGLDIIAAGVYHQPQVVFSFAMMIYNTLCWLYTKLGFDDIHAAGVIGI